MFNTRADNVLSVLAAVFVACERASPASKFLPRLIARELSSNSPMTRFHQRTKRGTRFYSAACRWTKNCSDPSWHSYRDKLGGREGDEGDGRDGSDDALAEARSQSMWRGYWRLTPVGVALRTRCAAGRVRERALERRHRLPHHR